MFRRKKTVHPLAPHIVCKLPTRRSLQLPWPVGASVSLNFFDSHFPFIFTLISIVYDRPYNVHEVEVTILGGPNLM